MTQATDSTASHGRVLVTGASGYIGGRLVHALEAEGAPVRCMARRPEFLRPRVASSTEVVAGDVLAPQTLAAALGGIDTAYYLVHSMGHARDYADADRRGADNFARAAAEAGVRRIVYLGGLVDPTEATAPHMRSRLEVGDRLRAGDVPVLEFRASIVIGSGSLSFEMIRALVERLPVMVTPRWVGQEAQPIAVEDVVRYLLAARDAPGGSRIYEIGGATRATYGDLIRGYAAERGLRRRLLAVPVLSPRLSSLWLTFVTPLYAGVGRELVESMRHASVVRDETAHRHFPFVPLDHREAIRRALRNEDHAFAETRWSDALSAGGGLPVWAGVRFGNRLVDSRTLVVPLTPAQAFAPIARIGGATGYYAFDGLWRLRGWLDLLVGGVGLRRGRRDPERLLPGDVVDFWRVEACDPPQRLQLAAEMRLPGRAWLIYEVEPTADGQSTIRQTAVFDPVGLAGQAYWYAVYPLHQLVFARMLDAIGATAHRQAETTR